MIMDWMYEKLSQKRDKERQEVLKLKWQLAEMESRVSRLKKEAQACKDSEQTGVEER